MEAGQAWAAARAGEDEEGARLCSAYPDVGAYVLYLRLHAREWIRWLEAAAGAARRLGDRQAQGGHLGNLGNALYSQRLLPEAIQSYMEALTIARERGDLKDQGAVLCNLGIAYQQIGKPDQAEGPFKAALELIPDHPVACNQYLWMEI